MRSMFMLLTVAALALSLSCGDDGSTDEEVSSDSTSEEGTVQSAAEGDSTDPGRGIVLVGVTRVGTRLFALFEKVQEGTISPLAAGGAIGGRTVKAITLDGITCESDGRTYTVSIGRSLTGAFPRTGARSRPAGPAGRRSTGRDGRAHRPRTRRRRGPSV